MGWFSHDLEDILKFSDWNDCKHSLPKKEGTYQIIYNHININRPKPAYGIAYYDPRKGWCYDSHYFESVYAWCKSDANIISSLIEYYHQEKK